MQKLSKIKIHNSSLDGRLQQLKGFFLVDTTVFIINYYGYCLFIFNYYGLFCLFITNFYGYLVYLLLITMVIWFIYY